MTTWKKEIEEAADGDLIIACTLTEEELKKEFEGGLGCREGEEFTAWSEKYVYFPICYDGAEWVGRAERNPSDTPTEHQGQGGG